MNLDLGDSVTVAEVRKAETRLSIGGNPLIQRNDFDVLKLNDLSGGETFTGKIQVSRILEKDEKSYNTVVIEIFNDDDHEKLTLFVNYDSRAEIINVDDSFEFYLDFFNVCKSLNVINGEPPESIHAVKNVDVLKYLQALDSLDVVTIRVYEKENGYNSFVIFEGEGEY